MIAAHNRLNRICMARRKTVDATEPLVVRMDRTETGIPTMEIGRTKMVLTHATGKGRNRSWHFAPLIKMKPAGRKQ